MEVEVINNKTYMEECGGTVACVVSCAALCVIGAGAVNAMALAVIAI